MSRTIRGVLWMAGAALCFSASIGLVRHLSDSMSTFEIVFLRQLLGALVMIPWLWRAGLGALRTRVLPLHCARAAVSYLGMATSYYSVTLIPLADAVSLQFTSPLWVALLAMVLLGLLASCTPAVVEEEEEDVMPSVKEEVVLREVVIPPEKEAGTLKWVGTKLDGTVVEK